MTTGLCSAAKEGGFSPSHGAKTGERQLLTFSEVVGLWSI